MPTLPPEPPPPPRPGLHQARQVAGSFGTDAGRYDRARPPYPGALVERIIAVSPGRDVLDVGTGTGIAARQFQAAGCTVLGVDPDARMAAFARQAGVEAEVATFEAWDPAGRSFDAVVAGQAWHWVDQVAGAAKAAQVLRPGGRLAVFGHVYEAPPAVADALAAALRRVAPDSPFGARAAGPARTAAETYEVMFARAADGMRAAGGFGEPEQWRFEWELSYTREQWLDLLPTTGMLTRLAAGQRAEVLARVGAAIDELRGGFTMPYATLAATAARTA
jgi:SAM-dependent methyltransferase